MRLTIFILLAFFCNSLFAQIPSNLNFEKTDPEGNAPEGWDMTFKSGGASGYISRLDSTFAVEGRYSLSIESDPAAENRNFGACALSFPAQFAGKSIVLRGFLKTEGITDDEDSGAGLWMRIDADNGMLAFDNMEDRLVRGTTEWTEYSIELDLPEEGKTIIIGGLIAGSGKMWIDNLSLWIDGKPIAEAPARKLKIYPAKLDTAFSDGSGISIGKLTPEKIADLALLGKVWGFLKYWHPKIAAGEYNWDNELFRFLPKYLASKNVKQRNAALLKWIESPGPVPPCKSCSEKTAAAVIAPDLRWMDDPSFDKKLTEKLQEIHKNLHQNKHYYISMAPNVGNPQFINEASHSGMNYPDDGYRLLALYRYWNIIHYWFPYKDVIGEDWNRVLEAFIPKILEAKDALAYKLTATELIGRVHDTHANLWGQHDEITDYKGRLRPAVQIKFIEGKAVVSGYYHPELGKKSGLLPGDIITQVDGVPVDEIVKKVLHRYPASNYTTQLRDIAKDLLRGNEQAVSLTIQRDAPAVFKTTIQRYEAQKDSLDLGMDWAFNKPDSCYRQLSPEVGYIYLGNIKADLLPAIFEKFKDTKSIVIDIRNYPAEFVVFSLGSYLLPEPVEFVKFTEGDVGYPGQFTFTQPLKVGENNPDYYKGKVVILINEISQSQAEYTTMAFRKAPRATVIGSTTAGADGNVSPFYLPGGLRTMISGIGVFYPDGTPTQRVGIVPDIEVKPTVKGVKAGRDELLEKALEVINE